MRKQEGAKSGGVALPLLFFFFLPHALLPLFALASVSVTDCHVCVHNAGVGSLPPHERAWEKKRGTGGKCCALLCCSACTRTDREKLKKTHTKTRRVKPTERKFEAHKRDTENEDIPAVSSEPVSGYLHCGIAATGLFSCLQHSWSLM